RFVAAIERIGKVRNGGKIDPEYGAALYLLTAMPQIWEGISGHVKKIGIPFGDILENIAFSTSEYALVELAGNLFNLGQTRASPINLMMLDQRYFEATLTALRLRRYGATLNSQSGIVYLGTGTTGSEDREINSL